MLDLVGRLVQYVHKNMGPAFGQKASSVFLGCTDCRYEACYCEPASWYLANLAFSAWPKPQAGQKAKNMGISLFVSPFSSKVKEDFPKWGVAC